MPIYEFACPKCRRIFSFLSKRVNPDRLPVCPKCGNKKMSKQVSRFAMTKGLKEPAAKTETVTGDDRRCRIWTTRAWPARWRKWNVTWSIWTKTTRSTWRI